MLKTLREFIRKILNAIKRFFASRRGSNSGGRRPLGGLAVQVPISATRKFRAPSAFLGPRSASVKNNNKPASKGPTSKGARKTLKQMKNEAANTLRRMTKGSNTSVNAAVDRDNLVILIGRFERILKEANAEVTPADRELLDAAKAFLKTLPEGVGPVSRSGSAASSRSGEEAPEKFSNENSIHTIIEKVKGELKFIKRQKGEQKDKARADLLNRIATKARNGNTSEEDRDRLTELLRKVMENSQSAADGSAPSRTGPAFSANSLASSRTGSASSRTGSTSSRTGSTSSRTGSTSSRTGSVNSRVSRRSSASSVGSEPEALQTNDSIETIAKKVRAGIEYRRRSNANSKTKNAAALEVVNTLRRKLVLLKGEDTTLFLRLLNELYRERDTYKENGGAAARRGPGGAAAGPGGIQGDGWSNDEEEGGAGALPGAARRSPVPKGLAAAAASLKRGRTLLAAAPPPVPSEVESNFKALLLKIQESMTLANTIENKKTTLTYNLQKDKGLYTKYIESIDQITALSQKLLKSIPGSDKNDAGELQRIINIMNTSLRLTERQLFNKSANNYIGKTLNTRLTVGRPAPLTELLTFFIGIIRTINKVRALSVSLEIDDVLKMKNTSILTNPKWKKSTGL